MAKPSRPPPGNTNEIFSFMHCALCVEAPGVALPGDIEAGFTPLGIQVWCRRHNVNIVHVDFEGQRHPANSTRARPKGVPNV